MEYARFAIPLWLNQPHYVEVMIEKDTMSGIFENLLQPKSIPFAVNHGNRGYQFFTDKICNRIKKVIEHLDADVQIHILYFGDYDPSGANMSEYLQRDLETYEVLKNIHFKRVAINPDQIVNYDLRFKPQDLDTMEKLLADPNIGSFSKRLKTSPYYPSIKTKLENDPEEKLFSSSVSFC